MSTEPEAGPAGSDGAGPAGVIFYTRPGCPFSMMLRVALNRRGLPFQEVDIWQDPEAAAAVRAAANGNETVPTVNVSDAWMVNPSADQVLAAVAEQAPELLSADGDRQAGKPGLLGRFRHRSD